MNKRKTFAKIKSKYFTSFECKEEGNLTLFPIKCESTFQRNPFCKCNSGISIAKDNLKTCHDIVFRDFDDESNIYIVLGYDGSISSNLSFKEHLRELIKDLKSIKSNETYYVAPIFFIGPYISKSTIMVNQEMKFNLKAICTEFQVYQISNNLLDIHLLDKSKFLKI